MKLPLDKIKALPILAGLLTVLLQLCFMMYGCSNAVSSIENTDARSLYASKCGSCHRLLPPQDYSAEQWEHYVDKYGKKMSPQQKQTVLNYLQQQATYPQDHQQHPLH